MEILNQDRQKAFKRAIIFTVLLVVGIPCTVVGGVMLSQSKGFIALLVVGIACVAMGFYGTPIAWTAFGDYTFYSRIITAVETEHFYNVDEMSKYLRKPKIVVKNALTKCIDKRYLTGYKYDGQTLTLNENEKLTPTQHSVQCQYCGALVNFAGSVSTCPYCNAIVKYEADKKGA